MNKYLFFRTDRIGDFLQSAILIKSIKRNDPNSIIEVVTSEKNYSYIQNLKLINKTTLYPDSFIKRIFFFKKLFFEKYKFVIALDGKKRSIYGCILSSSDFKYLLTTKYLYKKFLKVFFNEILYQKDFNTKIQEIKYLLTKLNFNYSETDLDLFANEEFKNYQINNDNILLHFDEKWFYSDYIKKYTNIEPTYEEFNKFVNDIIDKTNKDLIITTGIKNNKILQIFQNEMIADSDFYYKKYKNNKILLYPNLTFDELIKKISNTSLIISCHGAPSHAASAFNKKIIDIYDKSEELFYKRWNSHFRRYNFLYRNNFRNLADEILEKL